MTTTMERTPRISVVTPSWNQGKYLERNIASVHAQDYPDLEHIVVDGMSTDSTGEVLARHRHLRVIREPDRGQADAINKGLRAASGDVFCVLNADDTLAAGALQRIAVEIDPAQGRNVVLGRCRFIDEEDRSLGVEHPSGFKSHRHLLEIWRGHMLPQPAVFWTREAWRQCGPFDESVGALLDYDFFCRLSSRFAFHFVDQVLAHSRLHPESRTVSMSDRERLMRAVRVSRRYWGPLTKPLYWQVLLSYEAFRWDRRRRAALWLRRAAQAWGRGRPLPAGVWSAAGAALGPDVLLDVAVLPALRRMARRVLPARVYQRLSAIVYDAPEMERVAPSDPQTLAWGDFDGVHADGWVGPLLVRRIQMMETSARLVLQGSLWWAPLGQSPTLTFFLDGRCLASCVLDRRPQFTVSVPLNGVAPGAHELRIETRPVLIPHQYLGNRDFRPLAFRLQDLRIEPAGQETQGVPGDVTPASGRRLER